LADSGGRYLKSPLPRRRRTIGLPIKEVGENGLLPGCGLSRKVGLLRGKLFLGPLFLQFLISSPSILKTGAFPKLPLLKKALGGLRVFPSLLGFSRDFFPTWAFGPIGTGFGFTSDLGPKRIGG